MREQGERADVRGQVRHVLHARGQEERRERGSIFFRSFLAGKLGVISVSPFQVEIMNQLNSPKLLQLFDAFENGRSEMCLVTE